MSGGPHPAPIPRSRYAATSYQLAAARILLAAAVGRARVDRGEHPDPSQTTTTRSYHS